MPRRTVQRSGRREARGPEGWDGARPLTAVLLVNPNTSARSTAMMLSVARRLLPAGVDLHGATAAAGPAMILDEAALAGAAGEVARIGLERAHGLAAIIVSAFGDPGAARLRALVPIPVIGIGEAAVREAAGDGRPFGIATTTPGLVRSIAGHVRALGLAGQLTGVRVPPGDPLAFADDPAAQDEALSGAARACIERDGAEAVVIGGGPLSDSAARLRLRFAMPIIEPVPAAVRALTAALAL